jgi:hypothetical protein
VDLRDDREVGDPSTLDSRHQIPGPRMAGAGDRERHEGWIRGGNRGGVGVGGRARAGSAEQGSGGRGGRDRELGDGGGSLHCPLNS